MAPHFVYCVSWDLARRRAGLRSLILLGGSYVADLIHCICDVNLFEATVSVIVGLYILFFFIFFWCTL